MKKRIIALLILFFFGCAQKEEALPYLGKPILKDGKTIYPVVKNFDLLDQDSTIITNSTLKGRIYVADFIFLRCPSICPIMNSHLKQVYDKFKDDKNIVFVSHTIDPENDSIPVLKAHADRIGVTSDKWHFLYGKKDTIYKLANESYYAEAYEDKTAPGGYAHSGGFLLIDTQGHIRGVYDGTNLEEVDRLIKEIVILRKESH